MLRKVLPHVTIVLCNMYIVFFLIDRVNTAMQFINNSITKALLLVLCIFSTVNASFLILDGRRERAEQERRRAAAQRRRAVDAPHVRPDSPAPRPAHRSFDRFDAPRAARRAPDAPRRSRYD